MTVGWDAGAQAFLDAGGVPMYFVAVTASIENLATGEIEEVGLWSGEETIELSLRGTTHTLVRFGPALVIPEITYEVGTVIRSQQVSILGFGPVLRDLIAGYELRLKPVSGWRLCFSQGYEYQGCERLFKGKFDESALPISAGPSASLELAVASSAREGTIVNGSTKSDAHYKAERGGDTGMEYASATDKDDKWK